jgi:hypothetical protein
VTSSATCRRVTRIVPTSWFALQNPSFAHRRGNGSLVATSLDVLRIRKLVAPDHYDRGIHLLEVVVAMLTRML